MRKEKKGGIVEESKYIDANHVLVNSELNKEKKLLFMWYCGSFNLNEWIGQTEKRLEKIEELTKADDYEYSTETKLIKKSK